MTNISNEFKIQSRFIFGMYLAIAISIILLSLPALTHADTLNRELQVGMSGADVSALQSFLAKDSTIYPQGLITGYYGFLTKAAVSNFQSRNGIAAVGRVGPATLPVLNYQIANWSGVGGADVDSATISNENVNVGRNDATVTWNTNEFAKGIVYFSTSPLNTYENLHSVTVTGANTAKTDDSLRSSQSVSLQGLNSNTVYYYMVYTTDQSGNVSVMWSTFKTNS